jgi:tetratricopeptide (TPR) repeat protein
MDLVSVRRRDSVLRCAVCHDVLETATHVCGRCGVSLHADCRASLARCPTLGCWQRLRITLPQRGASRSLVGIGVALALCFVSGLMVQATSTRHVDLWPHRVTRTMSGTLRTGAGRPPRSVSVRLDTHAIIVRIGDPPSTFMLPPTYAHVAEVVPYPGRSDLDLLWIGDRHYGLTPDDRLALVRGDGTDDVISARVPCVEALRAEHPVVVLEALVGLAGDPQPALTDPAVFSAILALLASPDPWIASAADRALGRAWHAQEQATDAPAALAHAASRVLEQPDLPSSWRVRALEARGRALARLGALEDADADFTALIGLDQRGGWALCFRGCIRVLLDRREEGLVDLRRQVEREPRSAYGELWLLALTGEGGATLPGHEGCWHAPLARHLAGQPPVAELGAAAPQDCCESPAERRCVSACFLGVVAERRGDLQAALDKYEAALAETSAVGWLQYAWAAKRAERLRQR